MCPIGSVLGAVSLSLECVPPIDSIGAVSLSLPRFAFAFHVFALRDVASALVGGMGRAWGGIMMGAAMPAAPAALPAAPAALPAAPAPIPCSSQDGSSLARKHVSGARAALSLECIALKQATATSQATSYKLHRELRYRFHASAFPHSLASALLSFHACTLSRVGTCTIPRCR